MKKLAALCLLVGLASSVHAELDRATFISLSASVLKIEVRRAQGGYSLGSGVVVQPTRLVTNCHVTRDAAEIYVLRGGARWRVVSQAVDMEHDLCVLDAPGIQGAVVQMGRSADVKLGQPVTALGYTGGLGIQNSPGNVVGLHRHDKSSVIRVNNWFSSGASGGGLFDEQLRLIGILTYRLRGGEAHYFAAPVDWLKDLLDDSTRFEAVRPIAAGSQAYWQKPVALQPNFLRAALLERDSNWIELESLTQQWLTAEADDAEPWYLNGIALEQMNRLPEARAAFERSVALEPASSEGWFRLGLLYVRQGQRELASVARTRLDALKSKLAARLSASIEKL